MQKYRMIYLGRLERPAPDSTARSPRRAILPVYRAHPDNKGEYVLDTKPLLVQCLLGAGVAMQRLQRLASAVDHGLFAYRGEGVTPLPAQTFTVDDLLN